MRISKNLSETLQIGSLICILLIAAIHYSSRYYIDVKKFTDINYLFQESLINGLARSAVPFFTIVSGIFFYKNFEKTNFFSLQYKKKFYTIFIPYVLASTLVYIFYLVLDILYGNVLDLTVKSIIYNIFIHPVAVQYWFLRDLMVLIIFAPLIFMCIKYLKYVYLSVVFLLWFFDIQFLPEVGGYYLVNNEILFFFSLGAYILINEINLDVFLFKNQRVLIYLSLVYLSVLFFRIVIDPEFDLWYVQNYTMTSLILYKVNILLGLLIIFNISNKLVFANLLYISSFSFFVFLFHSRPINLIIKKSFGCCVEQEYMFYFAYPIAIVISFTLAYMLNRYTPWLYAVLTGNRSPNKISIRNKN